MSSPFFPKKAAKKQALAQFRGKELVRAYFPADSPDFPIPKGDNHYAIAKRFEYVEKNLREAERHYKLAIEQKIRVESAVKDLAGVLHQQGRTLEACDLLERNKELFVESQVKFENLLQSLRTQTRNASFKYLKLWGLPKCADEWIVKSMFTNPNRIHSIFLVDEDDTQTAILQFFSLSAARKTIEGFLYASKYRLERCKTATRALPSAAMCSPTSGRRMDHLREPSGTTLVRNVLFSALDAASIVQSA